MNIKNIWLDLKGWCIDWWYYNVILKFTLSKEKAVKRIINYQLKPYKVDMDYVIENPKIDGIPWYQYYTFKSLKEEQDWEKYSKRQLRKAYPYMSDKYIEREFAMIGLMWGLKRGFDNE